MTTSNFKTFALAIAALFTFVLTSCEKTELATLTPVNLEELKTADISIDPHGLIDDENAINKPYNNLDKPYKEFTNTLMDDAPNTGVPIPKPSSPIHAEAETRRIDVTKPAFVSDNQKIVREDTGPVHTEAATKSADYNKPTSADTHTKPGKPVKPSNIFAEAATKSADYNKPTSADTYTKPGKPVKPSNIFAEAELKIRQLDLIDGEVHETGVTLTDRDGYPIR